MTTTSAPTARPGSVAQWLRLAATTVTVAAVAVALITGVTWVLGPGRSTAPLASRLGDPTITLADGVTLPAGPASTITWGQRRSTYGLPSDTRALQAAFGGPVTPLSGFAWATATGQVEYPALMSQTPEQIESDSTAISGLRYSGPSLTSLPTAPTYPNTTDQHALAERIYKAFGWPTIPGLAPSITDSTDTATGQQHVDVSIVVPNTSGPRFPAFDLPTIRLTFADDHTLQYAVVPAVIPTDPTTVTVLSAQQAFDDLRHHRRNSAWATAPSPTWLERLTDTTFPGTGTQPPPGPVTTARLVSTGFPGSPADPPTSTGLLWTFSDAAGHQVGSVIATPGGLMPAWQ